MTDQSLTRMIRESAEKYPDSAALNFRKNDSWESISYGQMVKMIDSAGLQLRASGIEPGDRVAVFSQNRPEWAIADLAVQSAGGVTVPIYATNTPEQVRFIMEDAGCRAIFIDLQEQLDGIAGVLEQLTVTPLVILFEQGSGTESIEGDVIYFDEIFAREFPDELREKYRPETYWTDPDATATIIYTSGTTGDPKGVMLSNRNFFHQFKAFEAGFDLNSSDRSLCFLPLSHVYERMWSYMVFRAGASNYYLSDPKQVLEYLQDVRPNVMVSVPRLYEKIYAGVMEKVDRAPMLRRIIFRWALKTGRRAADLSMAGQPAGTMLAFFHRLADRMVLKKLRDLVGGEKKFFSAGGAPLSRDIEVFFYSMGVMICQGYGLTESSPMITYNSPTHFRFGSVGKVVPGCEVKIADNGEILAKGDNISSGYFRNEEATKASMKDGWLYTGDIGHIDEDGYLFITDRIKDLIITSGGKNIAPQRIESMVSRDHYIEQCVAVGDRRNFIAALIVPNFQALEAWAAEKGIEAGDHATLVAHPEVLNFYEQRLSVHSADLARYEQIRKFTLLPEVFTQEGGELTPSLKVKRNVVNEKYRKQIDAMYSA